MNPKDMIEDLLTGAVDRQDADAFDVPAALRRISADVARHRAGTYTPPPWWSEQRHARRCLDALARKLISKPADLKTIARFAADMEEHVDGEIYWIRQVEPDTDIDAEIAGARLFACLLHLTGHPISARFWWKIAAGAGDPTSAFCVHLDHLHRGELREATWWLTEAGRASGPEAGLPHAQSAEGQLRSDLCGLTAEVDALVIHSTTDDGTDGLVTRPSRPLASRLEELAGLR